MKRALAAVILALGVQAHAGGLGTIEGTVVNKSGATLAKGVRVTIRCGTVTRVATLDASGHFSVAGLPEGTCTITGTGTGFQTIHLQVTVAAGSIATVLVGMASPQPMARVETASAPAEDRSPMPAPAARMEAKARRPAGGAIAAKPALAPPPPPPPMQHVKLDQADGKQRLGRNERKRRVDRDLEGGLAEQQDLATFAAVRVFPVPQYAKAYDGPRTDFRETIYWNPSVETGTNGTATVTFVASDAVTSFHATAEGFSSTGTPGAGAARFKSKLPLTLDAKLPIEVTAGDKIRLPITITNETGEALDADLAARFGTAFKLTTPLGAKIHVKPHDKYSVFAQLEVVATGGTADVELALASRGLKDEIKKTIRVVPRGFPFETSVSGTAKSGVTSKHQIELAGALPGSMNAIVTMYPSPLAAMTKGMEGMIREPGGCFEQTSSTNYPNIMILGYMQTNDAAEPALVQKTQGVLDKGYKLLTGFETKERGYEWFGSTPGHEALTAYGLMEFADMAKVYDVDQKMVTRTADWLMSRRDGKGGFQRSKQALDSFGRASEATTNAYIMWALAEARRFQGLDASSRAEDPRRDDEGSVLLALAANTTACSPRRPRETRDGEAPRAMQAKDGSFTGAKESITMSGGESLAIETTSLAVLAMIKAKADEGQIRTAVDYLNAKRGGYGQWGNTQATVLGLKALTAYAEHARQMQSGGSATLVVNGKPAGTIAFEKGRRDALVWNDLANKLQPGTNAIEVRVDGATLPYSIAIEYRSALPQSSQDAKVSIATRLLKGATKMGEGVTLRAHVENRTKEGIPMTLARVGIPGGMVFQTWQLKELRDKGLIDFYETRPREVILYWRALPPNAKKDIDLNLLATVPGTYEAPASSAYLYYTTEHKAWTGPVTVAIER